DQDFVKALTCKTLFVEVEPIGDDRDHASQDITSDQQSIISKFGFQKESINPCLKGNRQIFVKTTTMDVEPSIQENVEKSLKAIMCKTCGSKLTLHITMNAPGVGKLVKAERKDGWSENVNHGRKIVESCQNLETGL
uniref:Uncharacterized protein n=1 Tax=Xiphophorus maculatus TaxID=8083 RepID=A0A3B5R8P5_XIPMA